MSEINSRFDLMFDEAEDYVEQQEKEKRELKKGAAEERREVEEKGLCQGCSKLGYNRWVRNDEFYVCWDCFIHGLDCETSVDVPSRGYDQHHDYISRNEWEERWENNE